MSTFRVVIGENGELAIFADEGGFDDGKKVIEQVLAGIEAEGVELSDVGEVEQHSHDDDDGGHVHRHVTA